MKLRTISPKNYGEVSSTSVLRDASISSNQSERADFDNNQSEKLKKMRTQDSPPNQASNKIHEDNIEPPNDVEANNDIPNDIREASPIFSPPILERSISPSSSKDESNKENHRPLKRFTFSKSPTSNDISNKACQEGLKRKRKSEKESTDVNQHKKPKVIGKMPDETKNDEKEAESYYKEKDESNELSNEILRKGPKIIAEKANIIEEESLLMIKKAKDLKSKNGNKSEEVREMTTRKKTNVIEERQVLAEIFPEKLSSNESESNESLSLSPHQSKKDMKSKKHLSKRTKAINEKPDRKRKAESMENPEIVSKSPKNAAKQPQSVEELIEDYPTTPVTNKNPNRKRKSKILENPQDVRRSPRNAAKQPESGKNIGIEAYPTTPVTNENPDRERQEFFIENTQHFRKNPKNAAKQPESDKEQAIEVYPTTPVTRQHRSPMLTRRIRFNEKVKNFDRINQNVALNIQDIMLELVAEIDNVQSQMKLKVLQTLRKVNSLIRENQEN